METWIWIVVAVAFFWLMMRYGGCGGMAHRKPETPEKDDGHQH